MKKYTYSLAMGLISLVIIIGIFSAMLPAILVYAISLIYAYSAARYGGSQHLLPGLLLMVAGSLVLYGPSLVLLEIFLLSLYGIVVGISIFRRSRPEMIFFPSLVILFAIMLVMFYLQKMALGIDGLGNLLEAYLAKLQAQSGDAQLIMLLRATLRDYSLSLIFMVALMFNLFFCWLINRILVVSGERRTGRFMFEYFRLRGLGFIQIIQLYMVAAIGAFTTKMPLEVAFVSLSSMLIAIFYVQGLSLLVYSIKSRSRGRIRLVVMVLVSLFMPLVQFLLAFMGLVDQRKDFRKLEKL